MEVVEIFDIFYQLYIMPVYILNCINEKKDAVFHNV
jgi:hypothetical protein